MNAVTPIIITIEEGLTLAAQNWPIFQEVISALKNGSTPEAIIAGIRAAQVAASDEAMKEELKP